MPSMCPDVSEMLSSKHTQERSDNRQCLLWNIHFLSRIGLVFQGDGDEADSNSMQLLKPCGLDDPRMEAWLSI